MAALMASGCSSAHKPDTASAGQPGGASHATPTTPDATTSPDPDCAFDSVTAATIDELCEAVAARFEDGASCDPAQSDQLIPGGSPEVVVEFVKGRSDTDMGIDEEEGWTRAVVAVFGALG